MVKKEKGNDSTILALTAQIKTKKAALAAVSKFVPITNCSLSMDGERFNLHSCNAEMLTLLLVKVNALQMSATELGVVPILCGYDPSSWISDIKSKLLMSNKVKEEARLKVLEDKLTDLLSADKKTELIIAEIEGLI